MLDIFLYSIIYKIADEFDDEEIYNLHFPNGKWIIYSILVLSTIYLFYFYDKNSDVFVFLFTIEIGYLLILFFKYTENILFKLGEMRLSFDDPFTLLSIVQLPLFTCTFFNVIRTNFSKYYICRLNCNK